MRVPKDWPVHPLKLNAPAKARATCGTCNRSWDDGVSTSMTPTPSGRCPFEPFHDAPKPRKKRVERDRIKKDALSSEGPEDYVLNPGHAWVWITVDGFSVHIRRPIQSAIDGEACVLVDVYHLGREMEKPVGMLTARKRLGK